MQDCKEFQGELFGISNLFRDLSDKLFTSEIIELHKEHGRETEQLEEVNLSEQRGSSVSESETRLCHKSAGAATSKQDLEDLGMFHISLISSTRELLFFYNKDIVNEKTVKILVK